MFRKLLLYILFLLMALVLFACQLASPPSPPPVSVAQSGDTLFYDDFTNSTTGWDRFTSSEGTMDYDGSGYRFLVNALQTNFWSTPGKSFRDVRVDVDVAKISGPDENRIGLLCRYSKGDYYFFMISSDGYQTVGKYIGGHALLLNEPEMLLSDSIHTGLAVNHLRADCVGNILTFYVNGVQVAQVLDDDLPLGDVGLLAGTFDEPGVDIIFDNFLVSQP